jgi:hypothetical protein
MAGNVWEWTSSLYSEQFPYTDDQDDTSDEDGRRTVRGGIWSFNDSSILRGDFRNWADPGYTNKFLGFRCMRPIDSDVFFSTPTPTSSDGANSEDFSVSTSAAFQQFQNGVMIWTNSGNRIYVLYNNGAWASYRNQGGPYSTDVVAPAGLVAPISGFGQLWRSNSTVKNRLGWGLAMEFAYTTRLSYVAETNIRTLTAPVGRGVYVLDGNTYTWRSR